MWSRSEQASSSTTPRERRDDQGTVDEVVARIGEYARVGVGRVYLQHLLHEDIEMVELIGAEVVPPVAAC